MLLAESTRKWTKQVKEKTIRATRHWQHPEFDILLPRTAMTKEAQVSMGKTPSIEPTCSKLLKHRLGLARSGARKQSSPLRSLLFLTVKTALLQQSIVRALWENLAPNRNPRTGPVLTHQRHSLLPMPTLLSAHRHRPRRCHLPKRWLTEGEKS